MKKTKRTKKSIFNKVKAKKNKKGKDKEKKINFNALLLITFFTGVLLIISSYAWFYASLDVKVKFFNMIVSNESGLFISLDGVTYSSSVEISKDSLIKNLKNTYPNNISQWASSGLYPVSTNGITSPNNYKFDMYSNTRLEYIDQKKTGGRLLHTKIIEENTTNPLNVYIAFDIFLKNVSGSPYSDNLYLNEGTSIYMDENKTNDANDTINSMRIGFVKMGSVPNKSTPNVVQNIGCNNKCEMLIYEPNNSSHSEISITRAKKYGVELIDGVYIPTYAVIKDGEFLRIANGHQGTNIPLDTEHFALQKTITNFTKSIFPIPNGITKVRIYVWLEGQDIDSLETTSKGADISIVINFLKDLAGYN